MVQAGRPLVIDDADPADPGVVEVEAGVGYEKEPGCRHVEYPVGVAYGLLPGVEMGLGFGGQYERREYDVIALSPGSRHERESGCTDFGVGLKWQFAGETEWRPRLALAPSVTLPTADEGKGLGSGETDYDLTAIASKGLTDSVGVHVNGGYTWVGEPRYEKVENVIHFGLALDVQVAETLQLVGEIAAERESRGGAKTLSVATAGVRWSVVDALTLDMAVGTGLNRETPDVMATVGLTWAWGGGEG